jgi:HAD superfamily hydrolase (TIGR01490 family)
MTNPVVAIFDLDYTLTQRGTWGRFVWRTVKFKPYLWLPLLFSTASFQIQYKRGKIPRGAVKKTMMRWSLSRLKKTQLERLAEEFASQEVKSGLRPGGRAALDYHRQEGHDIWIASAAVDLIVTPIAEKLKVSEAISTIMAWDERGYTQDNFGSPNCYGSAKRDRVKELINLKGKTSATLYFYTDSKADLPLLDCVDIPVVVDPSSKFETLAQDRGIDIQYWKESKAGFKPIRFE